MKKSIIGVIFVLFAFALAPLAWGATTAKEMASEILGPETQIVTVYKAVVVPQETSKYAVVNGDSLSKIAKTMDTSVEILAALNPEIKNIHRIYPKQIIRIPTPYAQTREGRLEAKGAELAAQVDAIRKELQKTEVRAIKAETDVQFYRGKVLKLEEELANAKSIAKANLEAKQAAESQNDLYFPVTAALAIMLLIAVVIIILLSRRMSVMREEISAIKDMLGGEELKVNCPHSCGEKLSPKTYKRHVYTRCPNRPQENAIRKSSLEEKVMDSPMGGSLPGEA